MKDKKFYETVGITEHNATENQVLCQQKKHAIINVTFQQNCIQMIFNEKSVLII